MSAASALGGTETVYGNQSGNDVKITAAQLSTYVAKSLVLPVYTVTTLPGSPVAGQIALVSDATSNILLGAGGGTAYCLAAYTGSVWVAV
jgi:hypothetical protein